ncbi:cytochrome P450 [Nocardioides sp. LHG3406-4]|uniref:cytochrome P450 n=1 Tax=Nocardioides sp. LHG3406-4 TaxID=2804575 RepID=UPI003CF0D7C8
MSLRARLTSRIGRVLLARTMKGGLDLRALRRMPDRLTTPFRRDGLDPVPEIGELRERTPIARLGDFFGRGVWLVTGYADNRALLADGASFSNDLGQFVPQEGRSAEEQIGGLGMTDPPLHTELRRYLTPEFTKRKLARLEPLIGRIVAERLDAIEAAGPDLDLVSDFAFPIPFEVICELLGLPEADRERFHGLGVARFDLTEGGAGSFGAAAASREFLIGAVARQRAEPGPGLIGGLLTEHGDKLDDVTLGGLADGVFLGGYETSASMLGLGAYLVSRTPAARELLMADDESADRVVEELLRHLTVVQVAFPRFARVDVPLSDGRVIRSGDIVGFSLVAANRDPALAEDPDTFDPTRAPTRHLAFGHGVHRCVGSELARMELRIALRELVRRFPGLTPTAEIDELEFRKLSAVYGVAALPATLAGVHSPV